MQLLSNLLFRILYAINKQGAIALLVEVETSRIKREDPDQKMPEVLAQIEVDDYIEKLGLK